MVHCLGAIAISALLSAKLIVFPLDAASPNSALAWLGEGIALSLSDQLAAGEVKVVGRLERVRMVENLDLPPGARLSHGSMIRVAEQASADLVVLGAYAGTEQDLRIAVRVLEIKTLKQSGEMSASGPLSALPQMENELAWQILTNMGLGKTPSREKFQEQTRRVPNAAYSSYVESLGAGSESDQIHFLLKAVTAYRDFPEAQVRLGRLYFRKGDCARAVPHLLLGRDAGTPLEDEFMRGTCYVQEDDPAQAVQALSHVLQTARSFEVLNNLGVAYLREGDAALALNALQEAKTLARTDPTVALNLALARHAGGADSAARAVVEEALKSNPKSGMLQFVEGFLLKAQGESEKAAAARSRAKSLGVNVEKLETEDPRAWSRVLLSCEFPQ